MRVGFPCRQEVPAYCHSAACSPWPAHGACWQQWMQSRQSLAQMVAGRGSRTVAQRERALTCCFSFSSLKGIVKMSFTAFRPRTLATPWVDTLSTRCRLPVVGSPRKSTCRASKSQKHVVQRSCTIIPPSDALGLTSASSSSTGSTIPTCVSKVSSSSPAVPAPLSATALSVC